MASTILDHNKLLTDLRGFFNEVYDNAVFTRETRPGQIFIVTGLRIPDMLFEDFFSFPEGQRHVVWRVSPTIARDAVFTRLSWGTAGQTFPQTKRRVRGRLRTRTGDRLIDDNRLVRV